MTDPAKNYRPRKYRYAGLEDYEQELIRLEVDNDRLRHQNSRLLSLNAQLATENAELRHHINTSTRHADYYAGEARLAAATAEAYGRRKK